MRGDLQREADADDAGEVKPWSEAGCEATGRGSASKGWTRPVNAAAEQAVRSAWGGSSKLLWVEC